MRRLLVMDRFPIDGEFIISEHDLAPGEDSSEAARTHLDGWMEADDRITRRGDCFYIMMLDGEEVDIYAEVHGREAK